MATQGKGLFEKRIEDDLKLIRRGAEGEQRLIALRDELENCLILAEVPGSHDKRKKCSHRRGRDYPARDLHICANHNGTCDSRYAERGEHYPQSNVKLLSKWRKSNLKLRLHLLEDALDPIGVVRRERVGCWAGSLY